MTDKTDSKLKFLPPLVAALAVALFTATGGMAYRHEVSLLSHDREISKLRSRLYRERVRTYEYHERLNRAIMQIIELRKDKEGLSVVEKTRLNFYKSQIELIKEEKANYVETWKHEGQ